MKGENLRSATKKREATIVIDALQKDTVFAECPNCNEHFKLRTAGLFYDEDFSPEALTVYQASVELQLQRAQELQGKIPGISGSSESGAHAVNLGRILERLAPCLDDFCCDSGDCRSIFDPIDYVAFEGLGLGAVSRILFLEVKTGGARLSPGQRQIRSLVESKQVALDFYDRQGAK